VKEEFLQKQKEKLEKEKERLEKELSGFAEKNKDKKGDWNTLYPKFDGGHLDEEEDEVEEYTNLLPVEQALEGELQKVEKALEKIKKGRYGICEKCGHAISKARLEAYPQAEFCRKCQE